MFAQIRLFQEKMYEVRCDERWKHPNKLLRRELKKKLFSSELETRRP